MWFYYILIILCISAICGAACVSISESRSMEGGFWWGFFLWIIGIIVVAVRPSDKVVIEQTPSEQPTQSFAADLEKLAELKEKGIITQEEFDAKKKQLLGL